MQSFLNGVSSNTNIVYMYVVTDNLLQCVTLPSEDEISVVPPIKRTTNNTKGHMTKSIN